MFLKGSVLSKPVKIGVIGCGVIGQHHMAAAQASDEIELTAVADLNADAVKAAAEKYGARKVYGSAEALCDDEEIQGVVLALWAAHRPKAALYAFSKGKHVLLEKPIARNVAEVESYIEAAGDKLIGACASSRYHFKQHVDPVAKFIADGNLGDLRMVHCRVLVRAKPRPTKAPPVWRLSHELNGGGILVNWGSYDFDYLMTLTNWQIKPISVFAQTWQVPDGLASRAAEGSDAETHAAALFRCENNVAISYERAEMIGTQGYASWQIIGTGGSIEAKMTANGESEITFNRADDEKGVVDDVIWKGTIDSSMVHAGPITDFAAAIRDGRQPVTDLKRSLLLQQITDAIYTSARTGEIAKL